MAAGADRRGERASLMGKQQSISRDWSISKEQRWWPYAS
jgi:hypothetical protein